MRRSRDACSGGFLTRRRGNAVSWMAHAEVDVHPPRPRVGPKPAATRPLADHELATSLREDLEGGESGEEFLDFVP